MARLPRCVTCGRAIRAPVRGGRIYCSLECRPGSTAPSANGKSRTRAEVLALGPLESLSFVNLLALRRVAEASGGSPTEAEVQAEIDRRHAKNAENRGRPRPGTGGDVTKEPFIRVPVPEGRVHDDP
jgi:hypothetical protein